MIYVASSWRNQHFDRVVTALLRAGHEVYDFKRSEGAGFRWEEIDRDWQNWNVAGFRNGLRHGRARRAFRVDLGALASCDVLVLVLPSGRSAHTEAGWAAGQGKRVIVYEPEDCEPELMYAMFAGITDSIDVLVKQTRAWIGPEPSPRYFAPAAPYRQGAAADTEQGETRCV